MGITDLALKFMDIVLHLDKYLGVIIAQYGVWTYLLLFLVLFFETGVVFTPFLPGDSLLFTAGTMAGMGLFKLWILYLVCFFAVVLGDNCNYWIGHFIGSKILHSKREIINKKYVAKTRKFFHKYGAFSLILGRFIPMVRTFTPFLAGVGRMKYLKFFIYDIVGAFSWVTLFLLGGYFFGGLPFVQANFSLIVILIIFVSFIPVFYQVGMHFWKKWFGRRNSKAKINKTDLKKANSKKTKVKK
jgi:membrane-associated protein